MRRKIIIMCMIIAMTICGCTNTVIETGFPENGYFDVRRINALVRRVSDDCNVDGMTIYYIDKNSGDSYTRLYGYSILGQQEELLYETENIVSYYDVDEPYMFYSVCNDKEEHYSVYRCNLETGVEELVFEDSDGTKGYCDIYDGYLYIYATSSSTGQKIYRCREDGDFENDILTMQTNKNDSNMMFTYRIGDGDYELISCLINNKYRNSDLYQYLITCEGGNTVIGYIPIDSTSMSRYEIITAKVR